MKKRLFSGTAPTGVLTIGNYLGALRNWAVRQEEYDSLFSIVDMHALTVPRDGRELRQRSRDFLCLYLACGLDPEKSTLFLQSGNPAHGELAWILSCHTAMGELSRMTQYKAKAQKSGANAGLFTYPVLMAADILLYGTHLVPVGDDQKQHLELARRLAVRFNKKYGEIFTLPEPLIPEKTGRIMNLKDPSSKMDKSHPERETFIALTDTPGEITRKISRAKTDTRGTFDLNDRESGIGNLVRIYAALTGLGEGTVVWEYEHRGYGPFKRDLAEILCESLRPIRERYGEIRCDESYLTELLKRGEEKARRKSEPVLTRAKETVGLGI